MLKNELLTREIQRLREENAELKEAYAMYRERCANAEAILAALNDEDKTETRHIDDGTETKPIDINSWYPYNGDINIGIQTGSTSGGDTNGK